jgi:hypothetical protein
MENRLKQLSTTNNELSLAVEGRFTNLRIWKSKDKVYMRLDRANQYSAPLSEKSFGYLNNPPAEIKELLKFGFESSIENIPAIIELTKNLKERQCISW